MPVGAILTMSLIAIIAIAIGPLHPRGCELTFEARPGRPRGRRRTSRNGGQLDRPNRGENRRACGAPCEWLSDREVQREGQQRQRRVLRVRSCHLPERPRGSLGRRLGLRSAWRAVSRSYVDDRTGLPGTGRPNLRLVAVRDSGATPPRSQGRLTVAEQVQSSRFGVHSPEDCPRDLPRPFLAPDRRQLRAGLARNPGWDTSRRDRGLRDRRCNRARPWRGEAAAAGGQLRTVGRALAPTLPMWLYRSRATVATLLASGLVVLAVGAGFGFAKLVADESLVRVDSSGTSVVTLPSGQDLLYVGLLGEHAPRPFGPGQVHIVQLSTGRVIRSRFDPSLDRNSPDGVASLGLISFVIPQPGSFRVTIDGPRRLSVWAGTSPGTTVRQLAPWMVVTGLGLSSLVLGVVGVMVRRRRHSSLAGVAPVSADPEDPATTGVQAALRDRPFP